MKNLLKLSFLALILAIGLNANAQGASSNLYSSNGEEGLSFGIKAGVNFAGFSGKGAKDLNGKIGYNVGVFAEYTLPASIYVLTGLDFTAKGAKIEEKDDGDMYKVTYSPLYLQLPIHIGYKVVLAENINLGIHAGPYLAYGIGGKVKMKYTSSERDTEKEDENFFGSEKDGGFKSLDLGLGFGADLEFGKYRIGLGYDLGLSNIGRDKDYPIKNKNLSINIGYKF